MDCGNHSNLFHNVHPPETHLIWLRFKNLRWVFSYQIGIEIKNTWCVTTDHLSTKNWFQYLLTWCVTNRDTVPHPQHPYFNCIDGLQTLLRKSRWNTPLQVESDLYDLKPELSPLPFKEPTKVHIIRQ